MTIEPDTYDSSFFSSLAGDWDRQQTYLIDRACEVYRVLLPWFDAEYSAVANTPARLLILKRAGEAWIEFTDGQRYMLHDCNSMGWKAAMLATGKSASDVEGRLPQDDDVREVIAWVRARMAKHSDAT